jgi:hypothetical protein
MRVNMVTKRMTAIVIAAISTTLLFAGLLADPAGATSPNPSPLNLGSAVNYAVLAVTGVTNTGGTVLNGDLGVSPGSAVGGFPPGIVHGSIHANDAQAAQAQTDAATAYGAAASLTPTAASFAGDQNGNTFDAGVYNTAAAFTLTGTMTLDGQGDPNAVFIFQVDAALNTAAASNVSLINGAQASNVFWQVTGAVSTGALSSFSGTVMAAGAITVGAGASLDGGALSQGLVTLANNAITAPDALTFVSPPTPTSALTTTSTDSVLAAGSAGDTGAITYSSNTPSVCNLDSTTGALSYATPGTCTIAATQAADSIHTVTILETRIKVTPPPDHTVTFDGNGATSGTTPAETDNVPSALTDNGFSQTGSAFAGWNTVADGSGTPYIDGATYPFTASVTLYAEWRPVPPVPGTYSPLTPVRICDTRAGNPSTLSGSAAQCNGTNNAGSAIAGGTTKVINVAGLFGVPADASAVILNVTAVSPGSLGYLTLFPTGAIQPVTSNLNYSAGAVVPNLVEVGTGTSGRVSIFSLATSDVVVDLQGYVSPTAARGAGAGLYTPLATPARLCDTRVDNPSSLTGGDAQCNGTANAGERLATGGTLNVQVATNNAIPAGATAAVLNVSVVYPVAAGYLTVYPEDAAKPLAANVNYSPGQVTGNRVIVPLSTSGALPGEISIFTLAAADVVVDVSGYYSAAGGAGSMFTSEPAPVRICDTRTGNPSALTGGVAQCNANVLGPETTQVVNVVGLAGVPTGAKAVVVNLTAVAPTVQTYLTVFPGGSPPLVADLTPAAGDIRGNLAVATIASDGTISIYNNTGSTDVVVDVLGWYS